MRPQLDQGDAAVLNELFEQEGCQKGVGYWQYKLTRKFVEAFDIVIVMSDAGFIIRQWETISCRPVVWRTVGMGTDTQEWLLEHYRKRGIKIVRYSPAERRHPAYLGEDRLIRFSKDPHEGPAWRGSDATVLTFSNTFKQRYPKEHQFFMESVEGLSYKIGGAGNDGMLGSIGAVDSAQQVEELANARAYFYCHGTYIPYTLNFIEAWIAGIPVVSLRPSSGISTVNLRYSEIEDLMKDGETGFYVSEPAEARHLLGNLLRNHDLATRVGLAGKIAATSLFGKDHIKAEWQSFLASC